MEQNPDGQNGLLDQKPISLKALVDKQNNRILFTESDGDFVDVLFSFLTVPMGTIVRNTRERPPAMGIGCMNNLYSSAETFDKRIFSAEACKTMLLYPRNGGASLCKNLKLKIFDDEPLRYFLCAEHCTAENQLMSHYRNFPCVCGKPMNREIILSENEGKCQDEDAGVLVDSVKCIVSDELEVKPTSSSTGFSILSKLGVTGSSAIEEREFSMGTTEVLDLLKLSLISETPLTKALLMHEVASAVSRRQFSSGSSIKYQKGEIGAKQGGIFVKMFISKSKKTFCYAEASEDFVNLLFSFLTIPLGYIAKQMHVFCPDSKGCIQHVYRGLMDFDAQNYKSNILKEILLSPKVAPGFGYQNQVLDVEECPYQKYYYWTSKIFRGSGEMFSTDDNKSLPLFAHSSAGPYALSVKDHRTLYNEASGIGGGFVKGPAMFTITDNLIMHPISAISTLSILNEMKVDFSDLDVQVVQVGEYEAKSLLLAALTSKTALTDVFLRKEIDLFPSVVKFPKKPKVEC